MLGIAVARYDFCARDMRELSLLKGDVVKIYTKMSGNGWWRGEANGKVSYPSRALGPPRTAGERPSPGSLPSQNSGSGP